MSRLTSPAGTVVEVESDLALKLVRRGWKSDGIPEPKVKPKGKLAVETVEESDGSAERKSEPKRKPGRPKKS